jgi:hypothetical protein
MIKMPSARLVLGFCALAALTTIPPINRAEAQGGTISGTVLDAKSGQPLPDAQISIVGSTTVGARSGTRGEFRLTNLDGATVKLRATRIGYQAVSHDARVGDNDVRIEMTELAVKLDVVVVTGTAGEAQKRSLGNSVGRVEVASNLKVTGPPAKMQDMLSVNVPGVRIMRASGAVGTGGTTRIRGAGSLSLSNEPLIYIDGVRSNNQAAVASFAFSMTSIPKRSRASKF